jgi:chaperonin GroES
MVNASGESMKNSIVPLPTKEPSNVLLQLFQLLVTSGKELASISEIFVGKMPGQNTPATTTMATVEQGMKLFTAIYKRIYKALTTEFEKLYALNSIYLDEEQAARILDEPITLKDFDMETYDICPAADPTAFSSTQKLLKAQALMELIPLGTVNPQEVTKRILEAQEQPNIERLMVQPQQQQPDPKVVAIQEKSKADVMAAQVKTQVMQQKAELDKRSVEQKQAQSADEHELTMLSKAQLAKLDLISKEMTHAQRLTQAREQHSERLSQQKANKNKDKK